jgi:hypothetical protein
MFCRVCGKCPQSGCNCRERQGFRKFKVDTTYHLNELNRMLGLEIELSDFAGLDRAVKNGQVSIAGHITRDSSVKPSELELVMDPLKGDLFLQKVTTLGNLIVQHGAEVNETCGLHVHVDGSDLGYFEMRSLIKLYSTIEGELFEFLLDPSRRSDHGKRYCAQFNENFGHLPNVLDSCNTVNGIKHALIEQIYGLNLKPPHPMFMGTDPKRTLMAIGHSWRRMVAQKTPPENLRHVRYCAFNLHSWFYRGTVEFRMFEGTTNIQDLMFWPLFCGWLVHLACKKPYRELCNVRSVSDLLDMMPPYIKVWYVNRVRQQNFKKEKAA